jgi:hypothetical protein
MRQLAVKFGPTNSQRLPVPPRDAHLLTGQTAPVVARRRWHGRWQLAMSSEPKVAVGASDEDAGVVYQHVDTAEFGDGLGDKALAGLWSTIAYVRRRSDAKEWQRSST